VNRNTRRNHHSLAPSAQKHCHCPSCVESRTLNNRKRLLTAQEELDNFLTPAEALAVALNEYQISAQRLRACFK